MTGPGCSDPWHASPEVQPWIRASQIRSGRIQEPSSRQVQCFFTNPFSNLLLEAAGGYLLVLNPQRQILAANSDLLEAIGMQEGDTLVGLRPGEALHCVHAEEGPHGCGTSRACAYCGAVLAILAAQTELKVTDGECRVLMRRDGKLAAAEFQVRVTPLDHGGDIFLAMVLLDISDQKRKDVFERLFFHDLANTVQCLEGWGEQLQAGPRARPAGPPPCWWGWSSGWAARCGTTACSCRRSGGSCSCKFQPVKASEILAALENQFQQHELARRTGPGDPGSRRGRAALHGSRAARSGSWPT